MSRPSTSNKGNTPAGVDKHLLQDLRLFANGFPVRLEVCAGLLYD